MIDPLAPFNPNVPTAPSGQYSTNLLAGAAAQAQVEQEPSLFAGYQSTAARHPDDIRAGLNPNGVKSLSKLRGKVYMTPTQLLNSFDHFDRDDFLRFRNLMVAAGVTSPGADPATVRDAYTGVISNVAEMSSQGITMSPMGFIKNLIRMNGIDPGKIGAKEDYDPYSTEEESFTGTKTQTSRNVTEIDEGEAWASIQSNLSQLLGRDPSDQETRDFTYRMGKLAASNPSISKTATTYKDGEAVSASTHTDPGFTNADLAKEAYDTAQEDPDYAEYRAASYLFNAAQSALGPIGG